MAIAFVVNSHSAGLDAEDFAHPLTGPPRSGKPIPCTQPADHFNATSLLASKLPARY